MRLRVPRPLGTLKSPSNVVRQFTPSWFTVVMSCGIVGTQIGAFPYNIPAKLEVGWAFWWLALVLFGAFTALTLGRFVFFPREALGLFGNPVQAMFLGAIPPSMAVITNGFPLFLKHWWQDDRVMQAAVVLWWVQAALALACTLLLPFFMFTHHSYRLEQMTAVWLMPLLPCVVAANSGGIVALHAELGAAQSITYAGYLLWGVGVPLCLMVMTIYWRRLMVHSLPPEELIVSSFLPVGPCGMGALGLMNLGAAFLRVFPPSGAQVATAQLVAAGGAAVGRSPAVDEAVKEIYSSWVGGVAVAVGTLVALILWGSGIWWLAVAVSSVGKSWRKMRFNIGWWGFVFPLGVFATACNELYKRVPGLDAMRPLAAILTACDISLWCGVMSLTVVQAWKGSMFHAPHLNHQPGLSMVRRPGAPRTAAAAAADVPRISVSRISAHSGDSSSGDSSETDEPQQNGGGQEGKEGREASGGSSCLEERAEAGEGGTDLRECSPAQPLG